MKAYVSEISHTQRTNVVLFHSYEESRIDKFIETKKENTGYQGLGEVGSYCLMSKEFFLRMVKKFWK